MFLHHVISARSGLHARRPKRQKKVDAEGDANEEVKQHAKSENGFSETSKYARNRWRLLAMCHWICKHRHELHSFTVRSDIVVQGTPKTPGQVRSSGRAIIAAKQPLLLSGSASLGISTSWTANGTETVNPSRSFVPLPDRNSAVHLILVLDSTTFHPSWLHICTYVGIVNFTVFPGLGPMKQHRHHGRVRSAARTEDCGYCT